MEVIWVLWTLIMGAPQGIGVYQTKAECETNISLQKAAKIIDTSKMKSVQIHRKIKIVVTTKKHLSLGIKNRVFLPSAK